MAGHDFMDYKDGEGGSDGCTDMSNPDNKGLKECLATGETYKGVTVSIAGAYRPFCDKISLADFLVIAAEAVMTISRRKDQRRDVNFKAHFRFGRKTATGNCLPDGILPDAEGSCSEVERVYVNNMGLTRKEATAMSGVHTVGRAQHENSGYSGWWSDAKSSRQFNNNFFVSLLAKGWAPKKAVGGDPKKNQWQRSDVARGEHGHEMMLNTDMCLAYEEEGEDIRADKHECCAWMNPEIFSETRQRKIGLPPNILKQNHNTLCGAPETTFGEDTREVCCESFGSKKRLEEIDCGSTVIPNGFGGEDVTLFANDEKAWLEVFQAAWTKATENGMDDLKSLGQC